MPNSPDQFDLIATAAFGLEKVVVRELADLGYESRVLDNGRVHFSGDAVAITRANVHLRVAERVLIRVGRFAADNFDLLFDGVRALPWENWVDIDARFPVKGRTVKSQLTSVPACQRSVKRAIVERLKQAYGIEELPESGPVYQVEVALLKNTATLTIDTTGPGLHKRGYRPLTGPAPLRETLAAAMVELSYWRPQRTLVDPFCGTGTIPIEAALIARRIAPGLNRRFAAESWPQIPAELWEATRVAARDEILPSLSEQIMGTDVDGRVVKLAREHARRAGVEQDIHFQQRAFADLTSSKKYGCIITNPPYGERMSTREEVSAVYQSIPGVLRRLPTWSHYVLSSHRGFEQLVGQRADRRRKLYNGRIECQYFQFHGPRPPQSKDDPAAVAEPTATDVDFDKLRPRKHQPPAPAFGGLHESAARQSEEFRSRLLKRQRHLRKWPKRGITCFRLYERDIPEIPLVVDRYEDHLHISEWSRPHDRTLAEHTDWLDHMIHTAADALEIDPRHVVCKRRDRQQGLQQYQRLADDAQWLVAHEAGLRFRVNLSDYIDTGLFLDHRITRGMVRDVARDQRVLNLFGYTGSFTVYAAAGGAKTTTTVDLSNTYLDWTRANLILNNLDGPQHRQVHCDAMTYLRDQHTDVEFDLAIVDPPTFSNSKSTQNDWVIQRDHDELLMRLAEHIVAGGVVYFSTNFRRFKLAREQLADRFEIREISRQTVPEDFRNRRIHRCWRMVRHL